jgi:hypothetical protein
MTPVYPTSNLADFGPFSLSGVQLTASFRLVPRLRMTEPFLLSSICFNGMVGRWDKFALSLPIFIHAPINFFVAY